MQDLKAQAARAAVDFLPQDPCILGIGTGSTVNYFIEELRHHKHRIEGCVVSSNQSEARVRAIGLPVFDLNTVNEVPLYIDGADEVDQHRLMIKGGGGALTREKIIATVAQEFICIVDQAKVVQRLGAFPLAVEVIPSARSLVARELVKLGGDPEYRHSFLTDNGNIIIDVWHLNFSTPEKLEETIKLIPGVVESGIFAKRAADKVVSASAHGIITF